MRSRPSPFTVLTLFAALAGPAAAAEDELPDEEHYKVRLEYLLWSPRPAGEIQKGFSDEAGTIIDARADLGIEKNGANQIRGVLRFGGSWKLRGSWSQLDFRGDVESVRVFSYGNTAVLTGQNVRTSLKGNYATSELEWDFVEREHGFVGLLAGVKLFDVDTLLLDADTSERVAESERLPVPVFGVAGRAYFNRWASVEGEFSGLTIGDRGHVWEWLVAGRVHVSRHLAATVGYRKVSLEGHDTRDYLKLDLGQWTFGAELSL